MDEHDVIETCDCRTCAIHTRDKWRRELESISAEIGLPPTMGPAPGELKRVIDDGRAAIATLRALGELRARTEARCVWVQDEDNGEVYDGACGVRWEFQNDGPIENETNFCPRCGGRVEVTS